MEIGEQLYLEPLKGVPGHSIFHLCDLFQQGLRFLRKK